MPPIKLDSLDKRLIELLTKNARRTSEELAKELHVTSSTIRRRIQRLLKEEVIHIAALPDAAKIGVQVIAIIGFNVSRDKMTQILRALSKYSQIKWVSATSGRFDIMAVLWIESTEELYRFIEREVGRLEGVIQSETFISLHVEKRP